MRLESFTEIGEVFPLKSKKRSQIKDFNYFFNSNEGAPMVSNRLENSAISFIRPAVLICINKVIGTFNLRLFSALCKPWKSLIPLILPKCLKASQCYVCKRRIFDKNSLFVSLYLNATIANRWNTNMAMLGKSQAAARRIQTKEMWSGSRVR